MYAANQAHDLLPFRVLCFITTIASSVEGLGTLGDGCLDRGRLPDGDSLMVEPSRPYRLNHCYDSSRTRPRTCVRPHIEHSIISERLLDDRGRPPDGDCLLIVPGKPFRWNRRTDSRSPSFVVSSFPSR